MRTGEELFEVENELQQKLRNKYRAFRTDIIEFPMNAHKTQIQLRIAEEYLKISEEELKNTFSELCMVFLKTCQRHQIPYKQTDILILTDDEIDRGLQIKLKNENDGNLWDIIFIPVIDLNAPYAFWNYTFLHELGHSWISLHYKDLELEEIFTDLVAISALKEIIPSDTKLYQETVIVRSYIGGEQGKAYFGKAMHKTALQDPESSLRKLIITILKKGDD